MSALSFLWVIFSICCFCCQITTPIAPNPTKAAASTQPTIFFQCLPVLRSVVASTCLRVSAMMNMV